MTFAPSIRNIAPAALFYFAASSVSQSFNQHVGGLAFLWSPTAVMIAALGFLPRRFWPVRVMAFLAASFLASGLFGFGWAFAPAVALCDTAEGLIAAYFFSRGRSRTAPIGSLSWLVDFVAPVAILAPLIIAAPVTLLCLVTGKGSVMVPPQIFVGHALGNIIFTPLALMVFRGGLGLFSKPFTGERRIETVSLLGLVTIVSAVVFSQNGMPLLFLPMVPLILVSFRLGYGATMLGVLIVGAFGTVFTMFHLGPIELIHAPLRLQLLFLQFFLATVVITALPVAADLENRAKLLHETWISEERYRLLAEHSTDIVAHMEVDGTVRYVSPSIRQMTGYMAEDFIGKGSRTVVAPEHVGLVRQEHLATIAAKGKTRAYEYVAITKSGERRWFESHSRAVIGVDGKIDGLLCVVRDISARKQTEHELSYAALTDPLTGLPNRRSFESAVTRRASEKAPGENDCVALFDIDRFKRVNDRFGDDAGDAVLQTFARVLRNVIRHDDIIARMGGEEFAILFPCTEVPQALLVCERLREEMAMALTEVGSDVIGVTVSGGVSMLGKRGLEEALKQADRALYTAKRGGRDQMALAA